MKHWIISSTIMALFLGCSSSDQQTSSSTQQSPGPAQSTPLPTAAATMDNKLRAGMVSNMPRVARLEGMLVGIFNPGTPLAQSVTMTPDAGGPPNSFTFTGPYDGNGDGINETTVTGKATFASDPTVAWSGVTGQVTVDVNIPIVGHVYHADINFSMTSAERTITGSVTFFDPLTGNTTTMTMPAGTPLVIKQATGGGGPVSNACGFSLEGPVQLEVSGPTGTLKSTWNFSSSTSIVTVNNRTFTDSAGITTVLADATVDVPCGDGGSINDWVGTYHVNWACLPQESGNFNTTLTVTGATTVTADEGDPDAYTASMIGPNPHAIRGFFIDGPTGARYREDFNWTMRKSLSGFAQSSVYVFIEGPFVGTGGLCVASGERQ